MVKRLVLESKDTELKAAMLRIRFPGSPNPYATKEWPPARQETLVEAFLAQASDEASWTLSVG